jgi:hypothetical protein
MSRSPANAITGFARSQYDLSKFLARRRLTKENLEMTMRRIMLSVLLISSVAAFAAPAESQAVADSPDSSSTAVSPTPAPVSTPDLVSTPALAYVSPTRSTRLRNYLFDSFGPYPIVGSALVAGINQAYDSPPEWKQGLAGYGRRFGSNFGIAAVTGTTRYALAQAFREDTMYYRCVCKGVFPRLRHAVISTFTARRGDDGHRVFAFSALVAPYTGTMTAVYAWYPDRFGAKDAFRMGNYNLLAYMGGNVGLEFFYSGPHSLLHRIHLDSAHAAPTPGSNP